MAIASLYRALVRHLVRDRLLNRDFFAVARALSEENRWRAQRYGTDGTDIDVATKEMKAFQTVFDETIALVEDDIDALRIKRQIKHLRTIAQRGTSAHLQLALYRSLLMAARLDRAWRFEEAVSVVRGTMQSSPANRTAHAAKNAMNSHRLSA